MSYSYSKRQEEEKETEAKEVMPCDRCGRAMTRDSALLAGHKITRSIVCIGTVPQVLCLLCTLQLWLFMEDDGRADHRRTVS